MLIYWGGYQDEFSSSERFVEGRDTARELTVIIGETQEQKNTNGDEHGTYRPSHRCYYHRSGRGSI
jgi:hypothetical protein